MLNARNRAILRIFHRKNEHKHINNNFLLTNNYQKNKMKKQYTQPELYVENVVVESGIALSYGKAGYAGQDGQVYDYEEEL